jgi:tetratricopeptide (TPR) repeat protein/tRNA A-37 threonylcarbamoyl transferase component Bud32
VSTQDRENLPEDLPELESPAEPAASSVGVVTNTAALDGSGAGDVAMLAGPGLAPGTHVGRYQIVELLGTGGGGRVYRAHDPHLSRDIALKVLHHGRGFQPNDSEYSRRLLREAKALAKLSHPNVVAAYDVGTIDDSVFVAMELVQGESLRVWLQRERRDRDEILGVLIAVGRGLIAAHAAGVMHRDIKPANVMVSPDGSARIVDFGLARALRSDPESSGVRNEPFTDRIAYSSSLTAEVTETALLSGTPGYIAPEILRGHPVIDAHADQYSYAVTVFLALTGQKPYSGNTLSEYLGALDREERPPWPRSIPRRVRRVVERGLARRHEDRYPSVRAFVDDLEKAATSNRRPALLAALGLGAALIVTATVVAKDQARRAACLVDRAPFAGIWDERRRGELERALLSTDRFNANEAFGLLAARLDAFESNWLAMKQDACEATHIRGEQSEHVLGLRNGCLERKLAGMEALVRAFSDADARSVDRAAAATPDSLDECADTATLLGVADRLPTDPAARSAVRDIESGFAVTRALTTAGRDPIAHAQRVLDSARKLGHPPTIAQAVTSLGHAISVSANTSEDRKRGEETLREGMHLAAQAGDDRLLARTASRLFVILSYGQKRIQEADAMLPVVEALVSLAGNDLEQRLEVLMGRGVIFSERRKYAEAIEAFDQVIALSPSVDSELRGYGAYAHGAIGEIDLALQRYPEAVRRFEAELDGIRRELGKRHPRVIFSLTNLGLAQSKAGLRDAAWATVASIRELVTSLYPPGDWRHVTVAYVEGNIWEDSGDCERALPAYRQAFETIVATYGPNNTNTADVQARLGTCLYRVGRVAEAIPYLERVLQIRTDVNGAPNVIAEAAFQLADVLWAGAAPSERPRALSLAEQALSLWRQDQVADRARAAEEWLTNRRVSPAAASARARTSG